jgi:hypothetical protein
MTSFFKLEHQLFTVASREAVIQTGDTSTSLTMTRGVILHQCQQESIFTPAMTQVLAVD